MEGVIGLDYHNNEKSCNQSSHTPARQQKHLVITHPWIHISGIDRFTTLGGPRGYNICLSCDIPCHHSCTKKLLVGFPATVRILLGIESHVCKVFSGEQAV